MDVETRQVRLRLTNSKKILQQLSDAKALRYDAEGMFVAMQFDSQHFHFRPGRIVVVGKTVADGLLNSSKIVFGEDKLSGEMVSYLERVGEFDISEGDPEAEKRTKTMCPICQMECRSFPRLARHLMTKHKKDRPDLYQEEEEVIETKGGVDWDTPVDEPEGVEAE